MFAEPFVVFSCMYDTGSTAIMLGKEPPIVTRFNKDAVPFSERQFERHSKAISNVNVLPLKFHHD